MENKTIEQVKETAEQVQQSTKEIVTEVKQTKKRKWVKPVITVLGIGVLAAGAFALFKFGKGDGIVEEIAETVGEIVE